MPKGIVDRAGPEGEIPTVSWPEHAAMETGDVVVTVEHCHGCHNHRMTTRHDPEVNEARGSDESVRESGVWYHPRRDAPMAARNK